MTAEGQTLSHKSRAGNYAPKLILQRSNRQGYRFSDFERAMQALLETGQIRIKSYGKPSDNFEKIIHVDDDVEVPF
jgi:hypothetical protein